MDQFNKIGIEFAISIRSGKRIQIDQTMVDVAQLVRASDCDSEGRGFESPYPPLKNRVESNFGSVFLPYRNSTPGRDWSGVQNSD